MLWVFGSTAIVFGVYWLVGGVYTVMDITNKPAVIRRYKIQPGTNEPVDNIKLLKVFLKKIHLTSGHNLTLLKVIWSVVLNQIAIGIPSSYVMYYLMLWRGFPGIRELPTFHWVLYELAIHILVEEAAFYYSHRSLIITLETSIIQKKNFPGSCTANTFTSTSINNTTNGLPPLQ